MHITERLGLNSGRPVTARESEVLSVFENLFIEEDYRFLRCGPTITLMSDFGTTIVSVPSAGQFSAKAKMVMVPDVPLSGSQIKNVVASASAELEADERLLVIERPEQPLVIVSEVELQRPYTRDELLSVFREFAYRTDVALGDAVRATNPDDEEFAGCSVEGARLKF